MRRSSPSRLGRYISMREAPSSLRTDDGLSTSRTSRKDGEVYVARFPGGAGKRQISIAGGDTPRWRRDGKEIFYIAPDDKAHVGCGDRQRRCARSQAK